MRFTSFHIKPALKGEVANVVSRRGYKAACSSLFVSTPQSRLTPCQLPVKGSLMKNGFHCLRKPRSSTQKFIVEAASEKKARHLACFDDSDASDAECVRPLERFNACRSFVLRGEYHLQRNARYYHKEAYKANSVRQFVHEYSHPHGA